MSQDPYYYPDTEVLINLRNIRDKAQLEMYEAITATLSTAEAHTLTGPFDQRRLQATHKLLFGRVYDWAGQLRNNTGTMTKGRPAGYTVTYGSHEHVPNHLAVVFAALKAENYLKGLAPEQFAARLAYYYGELDTAHCFREGNSRTLRLFTTQLARDAGHTLDWARALDNDADRNKLFHARDLAVLRADSSMLSAVVLSCLVTQAQERTSPLQAKETVMPALTTEVSTATAYVYDLDTNLVHAIVHGSNATEIATLLAQGNGEQYAVTHSPAFGTNDGLIMHANTNEYDTDARDFDVAACGLSLDEEREVADAHAAAIDAAMREDYAEGISDELATERGIELAEEEGIAAAEKTTRATKPSFISKEPIAVRLTEEQAKLLLSAEYPDDAPQQTTALYNVYNGGEEVNVMGDSVALDYSSTQKAFFAALPSEEKPALDQKLTQLRAENERTKRAQQRPAKEAPVRQQQRDMERD